MAKYGYRCENGHECSHDHLFCPVCGTPVSAVRLRHVESETADVSASSATRSVLCPVGHTNTPFDVYCGECGTELDKIVKEPVEQAIPSKGVPVAKCLAGHTVAGTDVTCPLCGLGIVRSSVTAKNKAVRPTRPQAPKAQAAKPQPTPVSSLGRTSRRQWARDLVKDYWAVAVIAAVVVSFVVFAFFLSSMKTTSSDSGSGVITATTAAVSSRNVTVEIRFSLNYALAYTTHSGVCGDALPTQISVLDGSGTVVGVGTLPVIPGTSNCGYKGTINLPPRDFYKITQRTVGELITVPAAAMSTGSIRVAQSAIGGWYLA